MTYPIDNSIMTHRHRLPQQSTVTFKEQKELIGNESY